MQKELSDIKLTGYRISSCETALTWQPPHVGTQAPEQESQALVSRYFSLWDKFETLSIWWSWLSLSVCWWITASKKKVEFATQSAKSLGIYTCFRTLELVVRPPARWAHGLLWWPRTAITNVVSCLVKRLSLFLYCLSEIKFTTTTCYRWHGQKAMFN